MISKCDLCGKKTTQLNTAASMLKEAKVDEMCNDCMERMNVALIEARKVAHKVISDAMVTEAEKIRAGE